MPGIADPGAKIVALAHSKGYKVCPLVGPSSIILAMAASGLNGQNFSFIGYLPIKANELAKTLNSLEMQIKKTNQAQIFIEAPYRNDSLLKTLLSKLNGQIKLCIAIDVTGAEESIQTKSIKDWNKKVPQIGKIPTIFILGT